MGDKSIPVSSEVKALFNSKGKQNVDEEGRVVEKKSNVERWRRPPASALSSAASPAEPREPESEPEWARRRP